MKDELFLEGFGFDCYVSLTQKEIDCCNMIVETGNVFKSWEKHIKPDSKSAPENGYNIAHQWSNHPTRKLYIMWLKAKTYNEVILSTSLIAKRLAGALTCSMDQFIREDGTRRRMNEIPAIAMGSVKAKFKFNANGEPTGNVEVELPSVAEVITSLSKLAAVDTDLVSSLKAKVADKKIKLNRKGK